MKTCEITYIFWDGDCGMCARCAHWLTRHDSKKMLNVIAFQDAPTPPMTPELRKACATALHAITPNGTILHGARAVLKAGESTRFRRLALVLSRAPFIWPLEVGYKIVAAHRPLLARFILPREKKLLRPS